MRIVFLGTPAFGRTILEKLVASHIDVPLVITQPDRPRQRRGKGSGQPSEVGAWAEQNGLPVMKPEKIASVASEIAAAKPDLIVVAAYGQLIPKQMLESGRWVNVHGSLLPKYRGASPVQQAILDGLSQTGVTIMEVVPELDAGPIISQRPAAISPSDTAGSLTEKIAASGAALLIETLPGYLDGSIRPQPQAGAEATMTSTLSKQDGQVDWSRDAEYLERFVRAMQPWPGASTTFGERSVTILNSRVVNQSADGEPGAFSETAPLIVATGNGSLEIATIKPAGKSEMTGEAWLRGLRRGGRFVSP